MCLLNIHSVLGCVRPCIQEESKGGSKGRKEHLNFIRFLGLHGLHSSAYEIPLFWPLSCFIQGKKQQKYIWLFMGE
jgi:hypothetical protein